MGNNTRTKPHRGRGRSNVQVEHSVNGAAYGPAAEPPPPLQNNMQRSPQRSGHRFLRDLARRAPPTDDSVGAAIVIDGRERQVVIDGHTDFIDGIIAAVAGAVWSRQDVPGDVVAVECPQGVVGGMDIQVQTHAGLMKVTVPQGVQPGATFLVRIKPREPNPQEVHKLVRRKPTN